MILEGGWLSRSLGYAVIWLREQRVSKGELRYHHLGQAVWVNATGTLESMAKLRSPPSDHAALDCVCASPDESRSELECLAIDLKALTLIVVNTRGMATTLAEPLAVRCQFTSLD